MKSRPVLGMSTLEDLSERNTLVNEAVFSACKLAQQLNVWPLLRLPAYNKLMYRLEKGWVPIRSSWRQAAKACRGTLVCIVWLHTLEWSAVNSDHGITATSREYNTVELITAGQEGTRYLASLACIENLHARWQKPLATEKWKHLHFA